jgi:hypothetical protein
VILRFLANENTNGRLPFLKYVSEEVIKKSNLLDSEKEKLRQRLELHGDYNKQIESIPKQYRVRYTDLNEIIEQNFVIDREYCIIAYNFERLDFEKVEEYIKEKVSVLVESGESKINTHFRRLLLIYDHLKIKRENTPNH